MWTTTALWTQRARPRRADYDSGMHIDEHDDWMDGFETWEEVWACLRDDWVRVVDVRQQLEVERDVDELVVVEIARRLRARHRRELHRLGFRPTPAGRVTAWRWDVAHAVRAADPADFPHPLLSWYEGLAPAVRPGSLELVRRRLITEELVSRQVRHVVQEVFCSLPADVAVVAALEPALYEEPDDEDEEDDGFWQLPTG